MNDERRLLHLGNLTLYVSHKPAQLQHQAAWQGSNARTRAVSTLDGLFDQRTQALVFDTPGLPLGEGKEICAPLHFHELEECGIPRYAPAVEPDGRRVEGERGDITGMHSRMMQRQNCAHGKSA